MNFLDFLISKNKKKKEEKFIQIQPEIPNNLNYESPKENKSEEKSEIIIDIL
jgi:hypothetical protein